MRKTCTREQFFCELKKYSRTTEAKEVREFEKKYSKAKKIEYDMEREDDIITFRIFAYVNLDHESHYISSYAFGFRI